MRTLTTVNGLALPPSPIKVGTVHVDVTKPQAPGEFLNLPTSAPSGVITIQWSPTPGTGPSGLFTYKLRQFVDGNPVPVEILQTSTPSFTFGSGQTAEFLLCGRPRRRVGGRGHGRIGTTSPLQFLKGIPARRARPATSIAIRSQTINGAGTASDWSPASSTIDTGLPSEIISQVSNYPNPVDTRKGGLNGRTFITYLLASDAQWTSPSTTSWAIASSAGASRRDARRPAGPEHRSAGGWDGTNESGQKVSKGGYLAQIKVGGSKVHNRHPQDRSHPLISSIGHSRNVLQFRELKKSEILTSSFKKSSIFKYEIANLSDPLFTQNLA